MKDKCLASGQQWSDYEALHNCVRNCEAGMGEILTMQAKHAEVARLTYAKNISRCEAIHGRVRQDAFTDALDDDEEVNATGLAHCISHNTDKVDRRFFGYYSTQRSNLVSKYSYP